MKRNFNTDLYLILGVEPSASSDEIRTAYMARARILHPDRFDQINQPQDWKNANDMMAELNEAYSILKNPNSRVAYDQLRENGQSRHQAPPPRPQQNTPPPEPKPQQKPEPKPSASSPYDSSELKPGCVSFDSLPKDVQSQLLRRQKNRDVNQVKIKLNSLIWNFVFIIILVGWFFYLYIVANEATWSDNILLWHGGITLCVGLIIGHNLVIIRRWMGANLKPNFYLTPIYFIKTDHDIITYWPIWTLQDISTTHHHKNGAHKSTSITFVFDFQKETLSRLSKYESELLLTRINTYKRQLNEAIKKEDNNYILSNNDFHGVAVNSIPNINILSLWRRSLIYTCTLLFSGTIFIGLLLTNNQAFFYNIKSRLFSSTPKIVPVVWEDEAKKIPPSAKQSLFPSTNNFISKPFNDVPIDKKYVPTKNSSSVSETRESGKNFGRPVNDTFKIYTEAEFHSKFDSTLNTNTPLPFPNNGSFQLFTKKPCIAPFSIITAKGNNYYVKLVDTKTNTDIITAFVLGGTTVELDVPLGTYEVRYASGDLWYGYIDLFGPTTVFSKADKTFTFEKVGNEISGYSITLYQVHNGNLSTSNILPKEF